jgi:hypothetical protein
VSSLILLVGEMGVGKISVLSLLFNVLFGIDGSKPDQYIEFQDLGNEFSARVKKSIKLLELNLGLRYLRTRFSDLIREE